MGALRCSTYRPVTAYVNQITVAVGCVHVCSAYIFRPMEKLLLDFEKHTGLGPTKAAKLLGFAYPTYAQYRNGERPIKKYGRRCVQAMMLLSQENLDAMIKEHVFNGR